MDLSKIHRADDPESVNKHAGRHKGGKALIVLGGYSSINWQELYATIQPNVILGANGVNSLVPNLDYWLMMENLTRMYRLSREGDSDALAYMEMINRDSGAKTRLVSWHSFRLLTDTRNAIRVRRQPYEISEIPKDFTFREYGLGYLAGGFSSHPEAWRENIHVNVGTVALQLIHHAGLLGVSEIHTIGLDLLFRDEKNHHAYEYPIYKVDKYRNENQFVEYRGAMTQWLWVETALYFKQIEYIFARDGIVWRDHSRGLLELEGLACAV